MKPYNLKPSKVSKAALLLLALAFVSQSNAENLVVNFNEDLWFEWWADDLNGKYESPDGVNWIFSEVSFSEDNAFGDYALVLKNKDNSTAESFMRATPTKGNFSHAVVYLRELADGPIYANLKHKFAYEDDDDPFVSDEVEKPDYRQGIANISADNHTDRIIVGLAGDRRDNICPSLSVYLPEATDYTDVGIGSIEFVSIPDEVYTTIAEWREEASGIAAISSRATVIAQSADRLWLRDPEGTDLPVIGVTSKFIPGDIIEAYFAGTPSDDGSMTASDLTFSKAGHTAVPEGKLITIADISAERPGSYIRINSVTLVKNDDGTSRIVSGDTSIDADMITDSPVYDESGSVRAIVGQNGRLEVTGFIPDNSTTFDFSSRDAISYEMPSDKDITTTDNEISFPVGAKFSTPTSAMTIETIGNGSWVSYDFNNRGILKFGNTSFSFMPTTDESEIKKIIFTIRPNSEGKKGTVLFNGKPLKTEDHTQIWEAPVSRAGSAAVVFSSNGDIPVYLEKARIEYSNDTSSIEETLAEDSTATPVYYTIDGLNTGTAQLSRPGIYIKVCGHTVTKIAVK